MKLRSVLAIVALFLSLVISADNRSSECAGCWMPAANSPTVEEALGVNVHFVDPKPGEVRMISEAGFRWIRTDFKWDATERERGQYDFSAYDRLMKSLDAAGLHAMFILDYGNPLYGDGAPRTDAARQAFAKWAVAAARHFGNRGIIWEIYNEPNNGMFWHPPNASEYAALARTVGDALRESAPDEKLIGPAVGEMDFAFLESCIKAGALDHWTAVSVHPYLRNDPENVASQYARLRAMIAEQADSDTTSPDLISSEWGYSSVWSRMNDDRQAMMLARSFLTNLANGIPLSIWYDWRDDGTEPREAEHHFGVVHHEYKAGSGSVYEPKPAFLAIKTLTTTLKGFRFERRLDVGNSDNYVLVFSREAERRIVAWTSSSVPHQVTLPDTSGQFTLRKMTGTDDRRVAATSLGLTIEVSTSPVYLIPQ